MITITLKSPAISCNHCIHSIQTELAELPGVTAVSAKADTKLVTVSFEPPATQASIEGLLSEIGYPPERLVQL